MRYLLALAVAVVWILVVPLGPVILVLGEGHGVHTGDVLILLFLSYWLLTWPEDVLE